MTAALAHSLDRSVVIRAAEHHDPGLGRLATGFEAALPGEVHVQLYATPAGTNSYGWHYDLVFVVMNLVIIFTNGGSYVLWK